MQAGRRWLQCWGCSASAGLLLDEGLRARAALMAAAPSPPSYCANKASPSSTCTYRDRFWVSAAEPERQM